MTSLETELRILGEATPLTVGYNMMCHICDAGMDRQRNRLLSAVRSGRIVFRDSNLQPGASSAYETTMAGVRRRLYATDQDGRTLVGADVAVAIWRLTPSEGWLAAVFGDPFVRLVTGFADILYSWNRHRRRS